MSEKDRNKQLFLLLDFLIGESKFEAISMLETMVKNDSLSMQKTFEIMTESNEIYQKLKNV